jgi:hypothetical protein
MQGVLPAPVSRRFAFVRILPAPSTAREFYKTTAMLNDDRCENVRPARRTRPTRRRSIDERLKRLADLFELRDRTKTEYVARKNELLIERNQLEAQPAAASIALQRQRLESIVDDWSVMTDEEKKRRLGAGRSL